MPYASKGSLLDPDEALAIILDSIVPLGTESVGLEESLGRTLAEDVAANCDLPPFDNSQVDGYAVIASDTVGATEDAPRPLRVLAEEPAGIVVADCVTPGTAVRIMTGAVIPAGADAVVMVEDTILRQAQDDQVQAQDVQKQAQDAQDTVLIKREASRGQYIRPAGEDVKLGNVVLRSGARIGPAEMGMLAALGRTKVEVHTRPRVAIITTGSEIVDVDQAPGPGQIRDSNSYCLLGQVLSCGAEVSVLSRVSDDADELERVLRQAVETSDAVITTGGVSVGQYDLVKETIAKLGEVRFWRVAIKPGKPLAYAHIAGKPVFGLPGNPVSSIVTFDLFVRPALLRMSGVQEVGYRIVSSIVQQDIQHDAGRREFVRAATIWRDGGYVSTPTGNQGSGRLSSMLGADSYVIIPETRGDIPAGESVRVILRELSKYQ